MTVCTTKPIEITRCKGRKVQVNFDGGEITSDAWAILLNRADKKIGLTKRIAPFINDSRCRGKISHKAEDMLRQRVYALALGYEDLNDHATLRKDYGGPQCQDNFPFNLSVIFTFPTVFIRLCHGSVLPPDSAYSISGSQVLRMGTTKSARRRELASAGAGFLNTLLFMPPTSIDFSHNTFRLGSVH